MYALPVNSAPEIQPTRWRAIWVLYLAGCTLALHIGKLPAALPLLVEEFDLSLGQAGNLVSIYALLIACGGLVCGMFVARIGYVLFAAIGVGLCLLGSLAGAFSTNTAMLMFTRTVEGLGWVMGVVALPVIMTALCADKDRPVVLGLWGAFVSVGAGTMLLLAPQLQSIEGWRLSWVVAAVLSGIGAAAVSITCHIYRDRLVSLKSTRVGVGKRKSVHVQSVTVRSASAFGRRFKATTAGLRTRGGVSVFVCFLCYSLQYVCVTSFLPTLLVQDSGMRLATASLWTAIILIPNGIGNIFAGWLINRGYKRSAILASAALLLGLCALVVLAVSDTSTRIVAALLMTGIGGIIPGTLFSTATLLASSAAGAGVIIGFMLTGAGIGQLVGPILLTRVVDLHGHWYAGGLLCLLAGLIGAYFARWLKFLPAVERS